MPEGETDIPKPQTAANLAELGAVDAGAQPGSARRPRPGGSTTTTAGGAATTTTAGEATTTTAGRRGCTCGPSCSSGASARAYAP